MSNAARKLTLVLALAVMATATGCGSNPAAARKIASTTKTVSTVKSPTPAPTAAPTQAPVAATETGSVMVMLSALQATNVAGVAVQLTGDGLAEPIGRTLTLDELKTSNTLAFENIPVGTLKAVVVAFDAAEEAIGTSNSDVEVVANGEAKVAIQLSKPSAPDVVALQFVSPEALSATPSPAATPTPAPTTGDEDEEEPTPTPSATPKANGKALEVEITGMATVRKFLLFKKLEVTVRVTNESATETLDGEVKVEFHKVKGIFAKEDAIVETLTAPVSNLAPGESTEVTLTSTVAAENAEATVNTILSSSSASTF